MDKKLKFWIFSELHSWTKLLLLRFNTSFWQNQNVSFWFWQFLNVFQFLKITKKILKQKSHFKTEKLKWDVLTYLNFFPNWVIWQNLHKFVKRFGIAESAIFEKKMLYEKWCPWSIELKICLLKQWGQIEHKSSFHKVLFSQNFSTYNNIDMKDTFHQWIFLVHPRLDCPRNIRVPWEETNSTSKNSKVDGMYWPLPSNIYLNDF